MGRTIKKRQNTLLRQKQIADAARKLIIRYGSEHITIRRISKEIGVSEGAIYRHFKSKRDILFLLVHQIDEDLIDDIERSHNTPQSYLKRLDHILRNHLSSIEQRKGISFLVIAEIVSLGDRRLNKKIFEVLQRYAGQIRDIVSDGIRSGEIRQDIDLDTVATLFFGMIQGLVTLWALSDYRFSLEQKYTPVWNILSEALRKN
jgi:AcrR family transcriptional regulator